MKLKQPETLDELIARAGGADIGRTQPSFFLTATGRNRLQLHSGIHGDTPITVVAAAIPDCSIECPIAGFGNC